MPEPSSILDYEQDAEKMSQLAEEYTNGDITYRQYEVRYRNLSGASTARSVMTVFMSLLALIEDGFMSCVGKRRNRSRRTEWGPETDREDGQKDRSNRWG
jgi:hypothetical protein